MSESIDIDAVAFDEKDEIIVNKVQQAVRLAMNARQALTDAAAEAIDTASTFGYELGVLDERQRVIEILHEQGSIADVSSVIDQINKGDKNGSTS